MIIYIGYIICDNYVYKEFVLRFLISNNIFYNMILIIYNWMYLILNNSFRIINFLTFLTVLTFLNFIIFFIFKILRYIF